MNLHKSVLQAIMLGCVLLTGCNFPQDYVDLMELPKTQRHETFRKLPIEKQVDFYLLRATFSHPPDTSFADDIALQGEEVIPYLLERLKKEPVDHRKHYIIYVFERIQVNSVDLRENKEVIGALEQSVNHIENPSWKLMSQESVQYIKSVAPTYAPDYKPPRTPEPPPLPPSPPKP